MKLTPEQRQHFDEHGYLFFPSLFNPQETQNLVAAVPELYSRQETYNVREKGSQAVRTNFAAHMYMMCGNGTKTTALGSMTT